MCTKCNVCNTNPKQYAVRFPGGQSGQELCSACLLNFFSNYPNYNGPVITILNN